MERIWNFWGGSDEHTGQARSLLLNILFLDSLQVPIECGVQKYNSFNIIDF